MSVYPAPTRYPSIFNPTLFSNYSTDTYLSSADANATYAKLAGGQTIVAEETFSGGIKTDTIAQNSGPLTILGNITQPSGYLTTLRTTTINGTLGCTRLLSQGTSQASSFAGDLSCGANVSVTGNLSLGSITTFASSFGNAATTHTITSTQLPWLANNNWNGELKLFADDVSGGSGTNGAISLLYLHKPGSTLTVIQGTRSTSTTITTTYSNTSLTVSLSNSCRLCWIFTGAT